MVSKSSRKYDPGCSPRIQIPDPDPGSGSLFFLFFTHPGSRIWIRNTAVFWRFSFLLESWLLNLGSGPGPALPRRGRGSRSRSRERHRRKRRRSSSRETAADEHPSGRYRVSPPISGEEDGDDVTGRHKRQERRRSSRSRSRSGSKSSSRSSLLGGAAGAGEGRQVKSRRLVRLVGGVGGQGVALLGVKIGDYGSVFKICIHLIRIRIQHLRAWGWIPVHTRILSGFKALMTKNWKKFEV